MGCGRVAAQRVRRLHRHDQGRLRPPHGLGQQLHQPAGAAAQIRAIYAYDTNGLDWSDIAYNFLVDKFGTVYEGRAGGISKAVIGAHTAGFNRQSFAIAALGCFDTTCSGGGLHPSAALTGSIARVMAWKLGLNWRDPGGTGTLTSSGITGTNLHHPAGQQVTTPTISGHRDVDATACPGNLLYPLLPSIRAQAVALLGAGLVNPALVTTSGSYASAGPTITSNVMTPQTWGGSVADVCRGGTIAGLPTGSATRTAPISTSWDGKTSGGGWPRPGPYRLTLTSSGAQGTAVPWGGTYNVNAPPPSAATPGSAIGGDGGFVAVKPFRLLDTRTGVYTNGPGGRVDLQVLGRGGVPASGVTSVYLTLTVTCPTAGSFLTVYAGGTHLPVASNQNFGAGQTRSALVAAPVGSDGDISIYNSGGTAQIVADVLGYGAATGGSDLTPVPLTRAYTTVGSGQGRLGDERVADHHAAHAGRRRGQQHHRHRRQPRRRDAVRPAATSTSTRAARAGPARRRCPTRPASPPTPPSSSACRTARSCCATAARPSTWRSTSSGSTPRTPRRRARATPRSAYRAHDTRVNGGAMTAGYIRAVTVTGGSSGVPAGAKAVLVNLTAVLPSVTTTLMAWADNGTSTVPPGALLRINAGDVRANLAVVPVGANGRIMLRSVAGSTAAIVDVVATTGDDVPALVLRLPGSVRAAESQGSEQRHGVPRRQVGRVSVLLLAARPPAGRYGRQARRRWCTRPGGDAATVDQHRASGVRSAWATAAGASADAHH